jgi:hypothetical protein
MVTLPRLRCPQCGKNMGPVKAKDVPPANKYEDCLRRCPRCLIGATNAKNPAKVKYIRADQPPPQVKAQPQQQPNPQDPQPPKP